MSTTNLKDLLEKVKNSAVVNTYEDMGLPPNSEVATIDPEFDDEGYYCLYLSDDDTCSEGCGCEGVGIEEHCPFVENGDYDVCCCFEPDEGEIDSDDEI